MAMKTACSIFILLHAAIHLLGFVKGFQLAQVPALTADISRFAALWWLVAFLLLAGSGISLWAGQESWVFWAIAGLAVSSALIVGAWSDAKFGMIPNLLILLSVIVSFSSRQMDRMIAEETAQILSQVPSDAPRTVQETDLAGLPFPVQKWLKACGAVGRPAIQSAWVQQKARMKMKPGQEGWHAAEAEQYTTTEPPAFIWSVRLRMMPLLQVRGRDKYVDGRGEMLIKLNALINIVNERGEKLDEGTLQRYLGELVWLPSLALSPHITWEAIDDFSAKATMSYQGVSGSGTFYFDEAGAFTKFVALRYMGNEPDAQRYPWVISAEAYAAFDGITVPAEMKASWQLEEGDWTWLELEIASLKFN
jgi:hypothetical protein